jgi:hypothetical protein
MIPGISSNALAQGVIDWMATLIRNLVKIRHDRGWGTFTITSVETGEKAEGFAYVTWNTETAEAARKLLEAANLLCDTNLDNPKDRRYRADGTLTAEGGVELTVFEPGDHVHVCDGPLCGGSGIVVGNLKESRHVIIHEREGLWQHPPEHLRITHKARQGT